MRGQDFEGDAPLERLVAREVDLPHPAGPERAENAVVGDRVAGLKRLVHVEVAPVGRNPEDSTFYGR